MIKHLRTLHQVWPSTTMYVVNIVAWAEVLSVITHVR